MGDILESYEIFTAHATIGAGYFMIQMAQEEMDRTEPKDAISKMVDMQTGYGKKRLDDHKKYICMCLIDIIEAKKLIEADYSKDKELFQKLATGTIES